MKKTNLLEFLASYMEGPKRGFVSYAGPIAALFKYFKGLRVVERLLEKDREGLEEKARKEGVI